jgi:tetratricopeptide (TPR) repeat protein
VEDAAGSFAEAKELLGRLTTREWRLEGHISGRLGMALWESDRVEDAEPALRAAADAYTKAAKADPEHSFNLADVLATLGIFYDAQENWRQAEKAFVRAATIYRGLVKEDPEAYASDLVDLQRRLAQVYDELHNPGKLRKVLGEMLALARDRVQVDDDSLRPPSDALTGLGIRGADTGQPKLASEQLSDAASIWRRLNEASPGPCRAPLRGTLNELSSVYSALGRDLASRVVANEADLL